jgi:hypothetical protein
MTGAAWLPRIVHAAMVPFESRAEGFRSTRHEAADNGDGESCCVRNSLF